MDIKLLSIDNQMKISDLDRKRYKAMGVHSTVVGSFTAAEAKLSEGGFDMIVINFDDETITPKALAEHYKTSKDHGSLPIVVTTVQSAERAAKALKGFVDLVIEFPIPSQQYVEQLRALLDQQTRQHQRINQSFTATITVLAGPATGKPRLLKALPTGERSGETSTAALRIACSVEDISSTGMLVGLDDQLDIGAQIEVQLQLPGYKKPFVASGNVVRQVPLSGEQTKPCGLGVKFHGFRGDSEKRLKNYLAKQHTRNSKISYYL